MVEKKVREIETVISGPTKEPDLDATPDDDLMTYDERHN
jgi:hypothetical protein